MPVIPGTPSSQANVASQLKLSSRKTRRQRQQQSAKQ
jgi:hypothetical protein